MKPWWRRRTSVPLIALVGLCVALPVAAAEWVLLSSEETHVTFVDKASITVRDPYVQGWFMFDYSVPQTAPNGSHYLSAKMLWSFDCGLRQLFPRQAVYYASNRGAGTSVHSFAPPF